MPSTIPGAMHINFHKGNAVAYNFVPIDDPATNTMIHAKNATTTPKINAIAIRMILSLPKSII